MERKLKICKTGLSNCAGAPTRPYCCCLRGQKVFHIVLPGASRLRKRFSGPGRQKAFQVPAPPHARVFLLVLPVNWGLSMKEECSGHVGQSGFQDSCFGAIPLPLGGGFSKNTILWLTKLWRIVIEHTHPIQIY